MASELELFQQRERSNWLRLSTLTVLRWIAIAGQCIAIVVAIEVYDLKFEVGLATMTVGASVLANLFSVFLYPVNRRLREHEAAGLMVFDVLQLGLLLGITGGLHNPFALLMLAPVTIAATVLRLRSTLIIGGVAILVVTVLWQVYLPVTTDSGNPLALPPLFGFGFWLALVIGIVFLALYARQVTQEMHTMSEALVATQLALAREQKLTDLGGVVAAAAHELGTPLATIKLVAGELIEELEGEAREDAALIRAQAERCRDILGAMGPAGKDDLQVRRAPLETVVREAAEPHAHRGKALVVEVRTEGPQPDIWRRPEVIHGLRNLIQNAVDFAASEVEVALEWDAERLWVRITDDGAGFPGHVLTRIGDPFMRARRNPGTQEQRPGYQGLGLGLFIAKTLLERTGALLSFANRAGPSGGAVVEVTWRRAAAGPAEGETRGALGANRNF